MIELLEGEYFIPIKDYEGIYEISNYGNVKDVANNKILHKVKIKQGFLVTLFIGNVKKIINCGMYVAKTFIPNPSNLVNVKYLDGNRFNCHVSNLEWSYKSTNKKEELYKQLDNSIKLDEFFVDIKGYEGLYRISNYGKVMALNYKNTGAYKLLQPIIKNSGYISFNLRKNFKYKHPKSHRLVALHFLDNPNKYETVNHKDGNKMNNHVSNLEWCTIEYNNTHAKEIGLLNPSHDTRVKNTPNQVREIRTRYANGETARQIAESYGISTCAVRAIKNKETWKWVM